MIDVDAILNRLIGVEGRYANHPSDRGGETMWGITEAVARENGYSGPMRSMPRATALSIYRRRYWIAPGFDKVALLSEPIAEELFDTGVNMHPSVPAGFLQQSLNALNRQQRDYPDIVEDMRIGPATLAALGAYLRFRGADGVKVMLRCLNSLQGARYIAISQSRPPNEDFVFGWFLHRVAI